MPNGEWERELWRSQEGEPVLPATEEIRAKARKYEREGVIVYWTAIGLMPLFLVPVLYSLTQMRDPCFVTAYVFLLAAFLGIAWGFLRNGPGRMAPAEPSAVYLRRKYEGKRSGLRWVRNCLVLLIPSVVASWLGHGPGRRARSLGVTAESWLRVFDGPAPFIAMALVLAFLWYALTVSARRFDREIAGLHHP